jgi:hypothetical protein
MAQGLVVFPNQDIQDSFTAKLTNICLEDSPIEEREERAKEYIANDLFAVHVRCSACSLPVTAKVKAVRGDWLDPIALNIVHTLPPGMVVFQTTIDCGQCHMHGGWATIAVCK